MVAFFDIKQAKLASVDVKSNHLSAKVAGNTAFNKVEYILFNKRRE
jgi:hypothetical protein